MSGMIGNIILIITGLITYKALVDSKYYEEYIFDVDKILLGKEYSRLFSSGFIHAGWLHYGFNMIALLSFSNSLEMEMGNAKFLFLYLASMIGGSLLSLYIHRNHWDYRALGASGAVSGVIFSSIVLFPELKIGIILLPIEFSSWVLAIIFVLVSILGIKTQRDHIGHEAHLGGAITGVLLTMAMHPSIIQSNWWIIALILIPVTAFLLLIVKKPEVLMVENYWGEAPSFSIKKSEPTKKEKESSLNELLDKIKEHGVEGLSSSERKRLDKLKDEL